MRVGWMMSSLAARARRGAVAWVAMLPLACASVKRAPTSSGPERSGVDPSVANTSSFVPICGEFLVRAARITESLPPWLDRNEPLIRGRCIPTHRGAWMVGLSDVKRGDDADSVRGTWTVVHSDASGARTTALPDVRTKELPPGSNYVCEIGLACLGLSEPLRFDYDGDGEEELVVWGDGRIHEGEGFRFGSVWTFANNRVIPYAPAARLHTVEARDMTGDGRPDLFFESPFESVLESPCSGFRYTESGPRFIAHALRDGTFSVDDAAAEGVARKACPSLPSTIVVRRKENGVELVDEAATFSNVACARVWGVEANHLITMLDRDCRPSSPRGDCDAPSGCTYEAELRDWATRIPPLVLH